MTLYNTDKLAEPFVETLLALASLPGGDGMVRVNAKDLHDCLTTLQARLDQVTEALIAARGIIVEDAKACRAFRHESEGPSGPENVLAKIDAALVTKGEEV